MTTIDKRIVNMQFDNQQFEKGVHTSLDSLSKLKKGLDLSGAAKGLQDLDAQGRKFSMGGIAESVKSISDAFSAFGVIGITVLNNLTNAAVNAGKTIVAALTIDPIFGGFRKYEDKIQSVQTIISSTGLAMDAVNEQLERLNWFTDETSYNFVDMVGNIGKFTAMGIELEPAVTAMQGIATWAAVSGQNSQSASVAMYNMAQALGTGSVKMRDWMSIVNANMATKEFKEQVIQTAKELGVLDANARTAKGTFVDYRTFNESLQDAWFTSDVLISTLSKYGEFADQVYAKTTELGISATEAMELLGDEILTIGGKAFKAAQISKTFTDSINATKDAVSSGWMRSSEIIFGDFDEAVELWTGFTSVLWDVFAASSEVRNEMLQGWKDLGGRTSFLEAISSAWENIVAVIEPIQEAFRDIFPAITSERLFELTEGAKNFIKQFKIGEETASKIKSTFKGLFAVIDIIISALSALAKGVIDLIMFFIPATDGIMGITGSLGEFLSGIRDSIKEADIFNKTIYELGKFLSPVGKVFDFFVDSIKKAVPFLKAVGSAANEAFKALIDGISKVISGTDASQAFDILNKGLFAGILYAIMSFVNNFSDSIGSLIKGLKGPMKGLSGILDSVKDSLSAWQANLNAKTLMTLATALLILTGAIFVLSTIDPAKLATALGALTVLFAELFGSMIIFENISKGTGFRSIKNVTVSLVALSVAILLLSVAVTNLSKLSYEELQVGLTGVGILLIELAIFMRMLDKKLKVPKMMGLIFLAGAVYILASAVRKFSELDIMALTKGLGALALVLVQLAMFVNNTGGAKKVISTAIGLTILAVAINILAIALKKLGEMLPHEIFNSLITMGAALAILAGAMRFFPKNMIGLGVGLVIVASALVILSKALKNMGGMLAHEIINSLLVLAGAMSIIVGSMLLMKTALPGAAALLVVAGALTILAGVMKVLGSMSLEQIGLSLLAIAGIFTIIGVASLVLGPMVPVILALSGALFLFGLASLAVGVGVLAFATGLTALSVAAAAASTSIVVVVSSLISLIPMVIQKLAEGAILLSQVIARDAKYIGEALKGVALAVVNMFTDIIPDVVDALLNFVTTLLTKLSESIPKMVEAGMNLILGFLLGVNEQMQAVVEAAIAVVISFINGVIAKLPDIIDVGFTLIVTFINGLAEAIRKNDPLIRGAIWNLITAIVGAFTSFNKDVIKLGKDTVTNIIQGIKDMVGGLKNAALSAGRDMMNGFISGISSMASSVANSALNAAKGAIDGVKKFLGIRSPSRLMIEMGRYFDEGFIEGIKSLSSKVLDTSSDLGRTAIDGVSDAISKIVDVLESDMDYQPTITPVIDLTDIDKSMRILDHQLNQNRSLSLAATHSNASLASNQLRNSVISDSMSGGNVAQAATYVFNQTNYSPKALSRFDIYRQTKNQLAGLKGLVNNT